MRKTRFEVILLGSLTFVALGCGSFRDDSQPDHETQSLVALSPAVSTVEAGETQQFTAIASGMESDPITWSVTGVGTIDSTGRYISSTPGEAIVTARSARDPANSVRARISVRVAQAGSFDGPAELPRAHVDSSVSNTPSPGKIRFVAPDRDLQSILNKAKCGDVIHLAAGATFVGHFILPAKKCDDQHWITVRTSTPDSGLPPEHTRLTPCYAAVSSLPGRPPLNCKAVKRAVATLTATKTTGPLLFANGANHYRIGPGVEITRTVGTGINYGLIRPAGQNFVADHMVIDRDWIHGTAQDETVRGLHLSGVTYAAVVDSYFSDFHCTAGVGACTDSQAVAGGSGGLVMGTWKVLNNFLEAGAENILFGGAAGTTTPSDIEILHNHFFKPLTWMVGQPGFIGGPNHRSSGCPRWSPRTGNECPFIVKNLFEIKNAKRVLVEGNILEYSWSGFTQHGASIVFEAANEGGAQGNPGATVSDITVRYNRTSHAAAGVVLSCPQGANGPPAFCGNYSIHDDIFDDITPNPYAVGDPINSIALEMLDCPACTTMKNIVVSHITMLLANPRIFLNVGTLASDPIINWDYVNNIVSAEPGLAVAGTGQNAPCGFKGRTNLARIEHCITSYTMTNNALIAATGSWPSGNFFPETVSAVDFQNYNGGNGGDYHLAPGSPYRNAGTDGKDLGANVDAVNQEINGAF